MTSVLRETAAHAAKAKKPLSDLNQIRQAIKGLQKDAAEQLQLEMESQATFAYLSSQLHALKQAFETLSDVDGVRKNTTKRLEQLENQVDKQKELTLAAQRELEQAKRAWDVWSLKERDWAKDNEILKASHSHNIEWMQALQRDVMETKDRVHELRHDHATRAKHMADEASDLRILWQKQVESLQAQLAGFEASAATHARETKIHAQQRLDDLAMMEQAVATLSGHHTRLAHTLDEGLQHLQSEVGLMTRRTEATEQRVHGATTQLEQVRGKLFLMERDQSQRMESISSMFSVVADAMAKA
ncbi:hypothetical protein SPRG_16672 [Saprolegnia parasitica CBS 223.65]|uniref:Uncharacterized protein n=1 Tax=Saprolegnia parasitica (strain CBS 223.65) TaxID=695850 RepID=A0A067BID0_SAPPC|nr:hypothetical protein SPRG_16672 [Saprolegnia parasitica CBS 223.65]KDO17928.1 hypothetical protein SPRG_16672 [Saprolegnia parasitica CBS 223.65]|eukprot:XP_012211364.1 hypothetical protein SPRG_16672 [Saprolegnia parasitica CBS 223.65]